MKSWWQPVYVVLTGLAKIERECANINKNVGYRADEIEGHDLSCQDAWFNMFLIEGMK